MATTRPSQNCPLGTTALLVLAPRTAGTRSIPADVPLGWSCFVWHIMTHFLAERNPKIVGDLLRAFPKVSQELLGFLISVNLDRRSLLFEEDIITNGGLIWGK